MPERQWRPAPSTDRPRRRVDAAVERAAVSSRRINHKRTPAGSPDKEDKSLDFNALPRASLRHFGGYIVGASLFLAWIGPCGRVGGIVVSAFPPA